MGIGFASKYDHDRGMSPERRRDNYMTLFGVPEPAPEAR